MVYVEVGHRKIAVEIQHSHQTLDEYLRRQKRYRSAEVECYWLLPGNRFITLGRSLYRHAIRKEFGAHSSLPIFRGSSAFPSYRIQSLS